MDRLLIETRVAAEQLKDNWYVVYVRTNSESKVKRTLDCAAAIPMTQQVTLRKNKKGEMTQVVKNVPKYKNYVYVQHDGSKDFFQRIMYNENIISFLTENGIPISVPVNQMDHILTHELAKNIVNAGDYVTIVDGQYKNLSGVIKSVLEDDICTVEIKVLNIGILEKIPKLFLVKKGD